MSTEPDTTDDAAAPGDELTKAELQAQIEDLQETVAAMEDDDSGTKMTIVAINGTLDMAYPTLILSSMAAAFDWDVTVFASFWALDILHEEKSKNLKLSSVGNPHMPVPNLVGVLPGMDAMTTRMMRRRIDDLGTDTVEELIERALEHGVEFQACQMTMDLMEYDEDEFIDGVTTGVGAGRALRELKASDVQLVV